MPFDAMPHVTLPQWGSVSSLLDDKLWSPCARNKLKQLSVLPENWDTYGSPRINKDAIEVCGRLVSDLIRLKMPEPDIFPVSGGGIQLEWASASNELEIEVMPDGSIEFLIVDQTGNMYEGQLQQYSNLVEIACLTSWFLNKKPSIDDLSFVYARAS